MRLMDLFIYIILVSLFASFAISLGNKTGAIEWLQLHAPNETIHKLFTCQFCVSWWTCVIMSILLALFSREAIFLLTPIFSTSITKKLL